MQRNVVVAVALAALALLAGLALVACGEAEQRPAKRPDLQAAERFKEFRLYHLGRSHRSLPMTEDGNQDLRNYARGTPVTFIYGDCDPAPGAEGRCAPPLAVSNRPLCKEFPALYPDRPPSGRTVLRGVPAVFWMDHGDVFDKLEVFAGETTVEIFAGNLEEARAAALGLRSADGRIKPGAALPRPTAGIRESDTASCRRASR